MTYRPYWNRHPIQRRLFALALLITAPVTLPVLLLLIHNKEIAEAFADNLKAIWKTAFEKGGA